MVRAKNMGLAARDSQNLTQDIVQRVIEYIGDGKKKNASRFLRNENQTETHIAAANRSHDVDFSDVKLFLANPDREPRSRIPWVFLNDRTARERVMIAVKHLNSIFVPYMVDLVCMLDEDGVPMPASEVLKAVLDAAFLVRPATDRVAPSLNNCLPDHVVETLKAEGRAELTAEQRRHAQVDDIDKWQLGVSGMTYDNLRILRGLLPPHAMPSLHQLASNRREMVRQYGDVISFAKTHSGYQLGIRSMLMLQTLSNVMQFCCLENSVLRDNLYVHFKTMIDGFNCDNISGGKLVGVHNAVGFLPMDRGVQVTDLCATDEAMRQSNPACKGGMSTTTLAIFLGKETFANMRANLTTEGPDEESDLLALEPLLKTGNLTVARMQHLCALYHISGSGNKSDVQKRLLEYIQRNRPLLVAEAQEAMSSETLHADCWHSMHTHVKAGEHLFDVIADLDGAEILLRVPEKEGEPGKEKPAKGADGKVRWREVHGQFGFSLNVDMKARDVMLRFGGRQCKSGCCAATFEDENGVRSVPEENPHENPEPLPDEVPLDVPLDVPPFDPSAGGQGPAPRAALPPRRKAIP